MPLRLPLALVLSLAAALAYGQAWERSYDLPTPGVPEVNALSEADGAIVLSLSVDAGAYRLALDALTGRELDLDAGAPPDPPHNGATCVPAGYVYLGAGRAGAVSVNAAGRLVATVVGYDATCAATALDTVATRVVALPAGDSVALESFAGDVATGRLYAGVTLVDRADPTDRFAFDSRAGVVEIDVEGGTNTFVDLVTLNFASVARVHVAATVPGGFVTALVDPADDLDNDGYYYFDVGERPLRVRSAGIENPSGACAIGFDRFGPLLQIDRLEGCFGKCGAVPTTTLVSGGGYIGLPTVRTCAFSGDRYGRRVIARAVAPDTGVVFAARSEEFRNGEALPGATLYEKRGGSGSAWAYVDSAEAFVPVPLALGTRDGGAVFVDTRAGGRVVVRKFDARGRLSSPRVELALADLALASPAPARPGTIVEYTFTLRNDGDSTLRDGLAIRSYISTDTVLSDDDLQDGLIRTNNLRPGFLAEDVLGASTLPEDLPAGAYTLFVWVDADDAYAEFDEGDNVVSTPLTVVRDTASAIAGLAPEAAAALFPNPTSGEATLRLAAPIAQECGFVVLDATGREVGAGRIRAETTRVALGALAPGYYTVRARALGIDLPLIVR